MKNTQKGFIGIGIIIAIIAVIAVAGGVTYTVKHKASVKSDTTLSENTMLQGNNSNSEGAGIAIDEPGTYVTSSATVSTSLPNVSAGIGGQTTATTQTNTTGAPKAPAFGGVSSLAPVVIYKPKDVNYASKVWVNLNSNKTQVSAYPAPTDVHGQTATALHGGYYMSGFAGKTSVPLNIDLATYATYTTDPTLAQLFSSIQDMNPYTALYDCTDSYYQDFSANASTKTAGLNSYIDNNQLSTKCTQL